MPCGRKQRAPACRRAEPFAVPAPANAIESTKPEIETTDSDFDREKLQERLAKLSGGVAVVKVGAATETEMKEKKHRVEDALQATRAALDEPLRQLAYNAGLEGSVVVNQVRSAKAGQGPNVDTGEIEDLVKSGIIDPTMVTRSALQNAASIAKNITEAVVAEAPEKAGDGMSGGMGGMDDMM